MKNIFLFLIILSFFFTCKKENEVVKYADSITLKDLILFEDSIILNWTALNSPLFQYYNIIRYENTDSIIISLEGNSTTFIDNNVPYSSNISYRIEGYSLNLETGKKDKIVSNIVYFKRPGIVTFESSQSQIEFDEFTNQLFIFEPNGVIRIVDINNGKTTKSINLNATIGKCDFGTYEGVREIYVPRNDGWIYIFNASNLEKIDQLNVLEKPNSVVFSNAFLFVSTANIGPSEINVYKRSTKNLIKKHVTYSYNILKKIPNQNNDFIEFTDNKKVYRIYNFDSNAQSLNYKGNFKVYNTIDYSPFEFFSNGEKYIYSDWGGIFDNEFNLIDNLTNDEFPFTFFFYNSFLNQLYCTKTNKALNIYSAITHKFLRATKTKTEIIKIFKTNDNKIFGIGLNRNFDDLYPDEPINLAIEQIK